MKIAAFLILLTAFPLLSRSQDFFSRGTWFGRDKAIHFSVTVGFTPASIQLLDHRGVRHSELKGMAFMFGVGLVKEFIIDKEPSFKDIGVNLAGCVAGMYLNRLILSTEPKITPISKNSHLPFSKLNTLNGHGIHR